MKVLAAFATGQYAPVVIDQFILDGPRENEVLIEIKASGICHSDLSLIDGSRDWSDYPIVLGHEGAGIVLECGSAVTGLSPGDKVVPLAIPECGTCPACRSRKTNLCDQYFTPVDRRPFRLNGKPTRAFCELGTFSQRIVVRDIQVAKVPPTALLDVVCCLGCAGATGLGAALYTAKVEAGSSVVVFGLGGIGLNVVEGSRIAGATTIIGVDTNPTKEVFARTAGVTHFINPRTAGTDVLGQIREITCGGADYSFECVGSAAVLRQAVECTRIGWGTTVMLGILPNAQELELRARSIQEGRRLIGSYLGNVKTRTEFPQLVDLYLQGSIKLENIISHRLPLKDIGRGFELLAAGEARRVVIEI